MKQCLFVVLSIILLAGVSAGQEESSTKTREVMISGGISYPYLTTEFRDNWKKGLNLGVGYGYSFDPGSLGYGAVFATFDFSRFDLDHAKYDSVKMLTPSGNSSSGGNVNVFSVMMNLKGAFSPSKNSIAPYFLIGVGYVNYARQSITVSPDTTLDVARESVSAFAWSFGVGVEVPVTSSAAFFVQGKSTLAVTDPTRQYFVLNAGARIRL